MQFAADEFSLIDEIPESEKQEWSIQELFQRDISWDRIQGDLVKYLRNENRPQFFNALTVALLPRQGHGFAPTYLETQPYEPIVDSDLDAGIQVGGIQIQPYRGSDNGAGRLRWDRDEVICIAVDGQHRLAALKELKGSVSPEKLRTSSVPVIFLIPDARLGFVEPPAPPGSDPSLVSALRSIFIDINKNARSPSAARQILLDDQDIARVCLRSLIADRLSEAEQRDRLPLAIVDWVSEKNKIDSGPFLTTVLLLEELVGDAIEPPDMRKIEDEADQGLKRWLQRKFDPTADQLEELMGQVRRCFNQEVPLTFLPTDLATLRSRFEELWRPLLYRLFSELAPYRAVWELGRTSGLQKPAAVNLYIAMNHIAPPFGETRANAIQEAIRTMDPDWNLQRCFTEPVRRINELKQGKWAFAVVFQRAMGRSFLELLDQAVEFVPDELPPKEVRNRFTTKWLEAVNALLESQLGDVEATFSRPRDHFWAGIGLKPDLTIDFTNAGRTRLQRWITAWVCLYWIEGSVPTLERLADGSGLMTIASNALQKPQVRRGFERLAEVRASGFEGGEESPDRPDASKLMTSRFDVLRKMKQG